MSVVRVRSSGWFLLGLLAAIACTDLSTAARSADDTAPSAPTNAMNDALASTLTAINQRLESSGASYRVGAAEWFGLTAGGRVVMYNIIGPKAADYHWVSGDPRRGGHPDLTYAIDVTDGAADGLIPPQTTAALDRAMNTWNALSCGRIPLRRLADAPGSDLGVTEFLLGVGGSPSIAADIAHAGWLPAGILPDSWVAVTFTYAFPTDDNGDGKFDTFFAEIYYNDFWTWGITPPWPVIDVETTALHEAGHALSLEHYGKLFLTDANDKPHWSPLAVMNPGYSGPLQHPLGTDIAGFCGIWGTW
jgi:hypothetical protein